MIIRDDIPAGYQLHVESYEGDGDYYSTHIISGLSEADVKFYRDLLDYFRPSVLYRQDISNKKYGNDYISTDALDSIVETLLERNPGISSTTRSLWVEGLEEWLDDNSEVDTESEIIDLRAYYYYDIIGDTLLGYPARSHYSDHENFCRALNDCRVFYVPVTISDVTHNFAVT